MKKCPKCKIKKDLFSFYKDSKRKDGRRAYCKECIAEYSKLNKIHKKEYDKRRRERLKKDPEFIKKIKESSKKSCKKYREKNKERFKKYRKEYLIDLVNYNSYGFKIKLFEKIRKDPKNKLLLQVKCSNCKRWFNPKNIDVQNRIGAVNGKFSQGAENKLYCSKKCKQSCPVYHKQWYLKDFIDPYCEVWTDKQYKESIKERDNYKCQNEDCWGTSQKLCIHHINYTKTDCSPINLITICNSCNTRANFDRNYWQKYYKNKIKEKK